MSTSAHDPVEPPDAVWTRARFLPNATVDWVKECNRIMVEYGSVHGAIVYTVRHKARARARKLIRHMVDDLRMHERWQVVEHTEKKDHGWVWSVEYLPRRET